MQVRAGKPVCMGRRAQCRSAGAEQGRGGPTHEARVRPATTAGSSYAPPSRPNVHLLRAPGACGACWMAREDQGAAQGCSTAVPLLVPLQRVRGGQNRRDQAQPAQAAGRQSIERARVW